MKKIFTILAVSAVFAMTAKADGRPVTLEQLPAVAQAFISQYYPDDTVSYATRDDDFVMPEYTVVLVSGVRIQFENNGSLDKISAKGGVPSTLVPVQIKDYVDRHYHDVVIREYEVGRRTYEIQLSNGMELKFNNNFHIIEIDD